MAQSLLTKGLMPPSDPVLADRLALTVPGMAHLAGTGPAGTSCRMCVEWGAYETFHRSVETGELRPRQCQKYPRLMQGQHGAAVPHDRPSCRHYAEAEKIPKAVSRREKKGVTRP